MQTSERINYIKNWINDYCKSMLKEPGSLIIGISGGIDSSVTSTICALTGKKTIVLSMPIKQIKEQHNLSVKHQEWLKNKFKNYNNIKIINRDILNIIDENNFEKNIIVFGNLPYNVSTKILASLILLKKWPPWYEILILMFH